MKISAHKNIKVRTPARENTLEMVQAEISRGAICTLNIAGVLVGLWAADCIVGGMVVSGGVSGWFSAVTWW